jgi:hypothetical protein
VPTAVKLFSAVLFAVIGALAAAFIGINPPEGFYDFWVTEISAALGLVIGWKMMSSLVGYSFVRSMASGLQTGIVLWIVALITFGALRALQLSMRGRYDTVIEVFVGAGKEALKFGAMSFQPTVFYIVLGGSILAGFIAEIVYRQWD